MNTITDRAFAAMLITKMVGAGKADRASIKATVVQAATLLQADYKGALLSMIPMDAGRADMPVDRWAALYVGTVMAVCDRHGRKPVQVMAAFDAALSA